MTDTDGDLLAGQTWQELLARRSFIELDALGRATALLDPGSLRVLSGPFARLESPWLEPQGITPQADDGTVIARGTVDGRPVVIASIEQSFQGGGTGEVGHLEPAAGLPGFLVGGGTEPAGGLFATQLVASRKAVSRSALSLRESIALRAASRASPSATMGATGCPQGSDFSIPP